MTVFLHLIFEIIKTKKLKNIEPKFIISVILGSIIWFWYGIAIDDFGLAISSASTIGGGIMFLIFYFVLKYHKNPDSS
jgi:uncharacterized protein with PQ loop repeat